MKVLHVIPAIAPQYGGPSKAVLNICNNLQRNKIETTIVTTNAGLQKKWLPLEIPTNFKNVNTIFFNNQIGNSFKYSRPFEKWLMKNVMHYDVVHIHAIFNHSSYAAYKACIKNRVPYILRPLGSLDPWSLKQKRLKKLLLLKFGFNKMINNASGIHYTSEIEKTSSEGEIDSDKGFVIPLSVDEDYLNYSCSSPDLSGYNISDNDEYILFLSRIHYKKGIEILISAFNKLKHNKNFTRLKLVIAGDGESKYVNKIKDIAEPNKDIIFTGWLNEDEKRKIIINSKLLVLPSYYENFGLCVAEAMALGIPVLITEYVNIYKEIIDSSAGWICEVDDTSLTNKLKYILSNNDLIIEYGKSARRLAEKKYSDNAVISLLLEMYKAVIN